MLCTACAAILSPARTTQQAEAAARNHIAFLLPYLRSFSPIITEYFSTVMLCIAAGGTATQHPLSQQLAVSARIWTDRRLGRFR